MHIVIQVSLKEHYTEALHVCVCTCMYTHTHTHTHTHTNTHTHTHACTHAHTLGMDDIDILAYITIIPSAYTYITNLRN